MSKAGGKASRAVALAQACAAKGMGFPPSAAGPVPQPPASTYFESLTL
jgi:hypothetical protein